MPKFPKSKNDILIQAAKIVFGIQANPADYPVPPFDPAPLNTMLGNAVLQTADRQNKEAIAKASLDLENTTVLEDIPEEAMRLIKLAEATHGQNAAKLQMIGWDIKAQAQFNAPGEVRNLEVLIQGPGSAFIDWKAPARSASVGLPDYYLLERRVMNTQTNTLVEDWGVWKDTATDSEKTVINQPRGVEITFRVTAVNKNGSGPSVTSEQVVL
jgi:hypothetical protein